MSCATRIIYDRNDQGYFDHYGHGRVVHDSTTNALIPYEGDEAADLSQLVGKPVAVRFG